MGKKLEGWEKDMEEGWKTEKTYDDATEGLSKKDFKVHFAHLLPSRVTLGQAVNDGEKQGSYAARYRLQKFNWDVNPKQNRQR